MTVTIEALKPHERSERVGIFGRWSSGKTTLFLKLALALEKAGLGKVGIIDCEDRLEVIANDPDAQRLIKVIRCINKGADAIKEAIWAFEKDPEIFMSGLDTLHRLGSYLEFVEVDVHAPGDPRKGWQKIGREMVRDILFEQAKTTKPFMFLTQLDEMFNEDGEIIAQNPALPGRMTFKQFGPMMDYIWMIEREPAAQKASGYDHVIYTKATRTRATKSSNPPDVLLPGKFPANDFGDIFVKYILGRKEEKA